MAIVALVGRTDFLGTHNDGTTSTVDTTGCTLLVVGRSYYYGFTSTATFTDSQSNTWTALTQTATDAFATRLYYCLNPSTSASHTWTGGGELATYVGLQILGFSGLDSSSYDQESGTGTSSLVTSFQPGSITPSQANQLFVTSETNAAGVTTLPTGYTGAAVDWNPGVNVGFGISYKIQSGGAAAENPTWTWSTEGAVASVMATFKQAAGGGGTTYPSWMMHGGYW